MQVVIIRLRGELAGKPGTVSFLGKLLALAKRSQDSGIMLTFPLHASPKPVVQSKSNMEYRVPRSLQEQHN